MAIQTEYWHETTGGTQRLSTSEIQATNYLKSVLQKDKEAFTAAPTEFSRHVLAFASPAYHLSRPEILFDSRFPQAPLTSLSVKNLDHAYIYLHNRDMRELENSDSWFTTHLLPMLPVVFSNKEVKIFNASAVTVPQPFSDSMFLIPSHPPHDSWLYAYDILSQSGLNYSESYEPEFNAITIKNLIIPMDLGSRSIFNDKLTFSRNTLDRWNEITGDWNFTNHGLVGKDVPTQAFRNKSVILSPVNSGDGKISLLFKVNEIDPKRFSHASIITSWRDSRNHDFAGIAIRNNSVYSYFGELRGGELSFQPEFPFSDTGIKLRPGDSMNLTISRSNQSQDLLINGTKYLGNGENIPDGKTGIAFVRVKDILFFNFRAQNDNTSEYTSVQPFFSFVKQGGNLFVLNSYGHGDIAESLKNVSSLINLTHLITLTPNDLKVERIGPENASNARDFFNILEQGDDFFALRGTLGNGTIVYGNLRQLFGNTSDHTSSSIYGLLGQVAQIFGSENSNYPNSSLNIREVPNIFNDMTATGKVEVSSRSVILPDDENENYNIELYYDNGHGKTLLENTTLSKIHNSENITIQAGNVKIENGRGLYSSLLFEDKPVTLTYDKNTTVDTISHNGSKFKFTNVTALTLSSVDKIHVYAKQPNIAIAGNGTINGLRGGAIREATDTSFSGVLNSSIIMSDRTSMLNHISLDGSFDNNQPTYDELSLLFSSKFSLNLYSLPPLIRILLLIPFIVTVVCLFYRKLF